MDLNKRRIGAYLKGSDKHTAAPADAQAAKLSKTENEKNLIKVTKPPAQIKSTGASVPAVRLPAGGHKPSRSEIARFLVLVGKDEAANILRHLDPAEVEAIAQEIASIAFITPEEAKATLERFNGLVVNGVSPSGGIDTARNMLVNAFGEERGGQILRQAMPEVKEPFFSYLKDMPNDQIILLLKSESTAVKSIVLSCLDPPVAAGVLKGLPRDEQKDMIVRMSRMKKIEREVLERVDAALRERAHQMSTGGGHTELNSGGNLAAIMRHLDPDLEQRLLEVLQDEAPDVVDSIRDQLFTIDTVLLIDDRDMQKVLQAMENSQIAMILKGKTDEIRKKLLSNVSDNRSAQIYDDYQHLGPQPRRDVDAATRDFIATLRLLEQEGRIVVRRDDEMYV